MDDRIHDRVHGLVPLSVRELRVLVCGVGMVGSWTAAALSRMVRRVDIVDFDGVDIANVGVQLYTPNDVNKLKVDAMVEHSQGLPIVSHDGRMEDFLEDVPDVPWDVVVANIDTMEGRRWLAEWCEGEHIPMFIDTRVQGELVCVLAALASREEDYKSYMRTLMKDTEVESALCGREGTVYCGMFAASRIAALVNNWKRGLPVPPKQVWTVGVMELLDAEE